MYINRNYIRYDCRLFLELLSNTDKYRIEKIFRLLTKSVIADNINPDKSCEHDKLFEPKNEMEKTFWNNCRELAKKDLESFIKKVESGKNGGRPKLEKKGEFMSENLNNEVIKIIGNAYKAADAVIVAGKTESGKIYEGIQIKNHNLLKFVRQRFDKKTLERASDWAIDHQQHGYTYNANALLKLLCKFQRDCEPDINFNFVQAEYLNFNSNENNGN